MKFIGKLFVITTLLAGFNIQPLAYAAPSSSEGKILNPSVPGKATTKANTVSKTPEKATHDKMVVTATAGNLQDNPQSQICRCGTAGAVPQRDWQEESGSNC